jgi:hypothetical protein
MDTLEDELMKNMAQRWLLIEKSLEKDILILSNEMLLRSKNGETITSQMVWKNDRYKIIKSQMDTQIAKYNKDFAVDRIAKSQELAASLGIDSAQSAIFSSYPSPLSAAFNRINLSAVESMIGFAGDGSPLSKLLRNDYGDAANGFMDALINGLAKGDGANAIARNMANGMGMGLDRALLIARTETQRAYRTGSLTQYRESGVVTGFYRLVLKFGACVACLAEDGQHYELAEEFSDHPRGRCTIIPAIRGMDAPEWEKGTDWFDNQPEAKQREILGNARYEMYKNGTPLKAFGHTVHSDVWGDSPQVIPLKDLKGGAKLPKVKAEDINYAVDTSMLPLARGTSWLELRDSDYRDFLLRRAEKGIMPDSIPHLDKLNEYATNPAYKLKKPETVWFGIDDAEIAKLKVGDTFQSLGTRSTAYDIQRAITYSGKSGNGAVFQVTIPKGAVGIHARVMGIDELMLLPNSTFKIIGEVDGVKMVRLISLTDDGSEYVKKLYSFEQHLKNIAMKRKK